MVSVDDVRNRLCGSQFVVRNDTPADELRAYRENANSLLAELRDSPGGRNTGHPAAGPTAKTFALYLETIRELESLIEWIDLALSLLDASTSADTCKALFERLGWPLDELSRLNRKQLKKSERSILLRAGIEVGIIVSSLANRSRFFSAVVARERRSMGSRKAAAAINLDHVELHPQYQPQVDKLMASGQSYTAACEKVATSQGVSYKTVQRHTKNSTPKNRGKWQR